MEFMNYLVSITIIGLLIQFGEPWMAFGGGAIAIIASKEFKAGTLIAFSMGILYFVNSIGMKEYWMFAVLGLVALGYLIGIGGDEGQSQDPYAGLMGGGGGLGGMM